MPMIFAFYAVVIRVPTRELALQTSQVCKELEKYLKIEVMVTTRGTSLKDDIMRLYQYSLHLLVGTPGRILNLTKKGICILKDCSMLVMDEVPYRVFPMDSKLHNLVSILVGFFFWGRGEVVVLGWGLWFGLQGPSITR